MKRAGTFKLKENWKLTRKNKKTGQILDSKEVCNDIVNDGLERVAKLLNGISATYFNSIAVGEGDTGVQATDSALESEVMREVATLAYEASYKATFSKTFEFDGDYAITEIVSGSSMLSRTVFAPINVTTEVDLIVEATITVSEASE
jgi:hypothetical protein